MMIFNQQLIRGYLGKSRYTIARWGCLDTVVTMIYDYIYGLKMTPDQMAQRLEFNVDGELLWYSLKNVNLKLKSRVRTYRKDLIDQAFKNPSDYIAFQVNNNHWVWVIGRYIPVLGYRIVDPLHGDKTYTNRYKNNITGHAVITR